MSGSRFDVAVIGAGPAGSSAARVAAEAGARVLLVDKAEFPRYKTCGGGLIGVTRSLLPVPIERVRVAAPRRYEFRFRGRLPVHHRASRPPVIMVDRRSFDATLLDAAAAAGASVRLGVAAEVVDQDATAVNVRVGTELVTARYVIAADGSASRAARYVGVACHPIDLGLEGEFHRPPGFPDRVVIDWGPLPGSYGWVFPKGERLSVGVIGARRFGPELREYYRRFTASLGEAQEFSGHLTRVRAPRSPLARGRVMVVGDAAGLLEPWTREGIGFAIRSGLAAGRAVGRSDNDAGSEYCRHINSVLAPEMRAGIELRRLFSAKPALIHAALATPMGWAAFQRIVDGRTTIARQLRRAGLGRVVGALGRAGEI